MLRPTLSIVLLLAACESPPPQLIGVTGVLEDENGDPDIVEVTLTAAPAMIDLGDGVERELLAYNGLIPGPVLEAKAGDRLIVHFVNEMDRPTTIHWHGLRIPDDQDGSPLIQDPVQPGGTFTYEYTIPDAASFWFHPHVQTNEQVELGLHSPFVVHGPDDPEYDAERVIMLDDVLIDDATGELPPWLGTMTEGARGRFGNHLVTNGSMIAGQGEAEQGHVERWRLYNVANARSMRVSLEGARFRVIGTDSGLLREPYEVEELRIGVAMRYDIEVSYDEPGTARLISRIEMDELVPVYEVEVASTGIAPREIVWPDVPGVPDRAEDEEVEIRFTSTIDPETDQIVWNLNDQAHTNHDHDFEPLFTFALGRTVRMSLRNLSAFEHPFHLHGQFFSVDDASMPGLRDTILVAPNQTLDIVAYFDNPGSWMAHCHNLEHAELGMMSVIEVTP
jgi:FtsP/CotA-like multicopper oxidase with cupredoxin domain